MSNLADFLKDITVTNSGATQLAGDAVGTLADLGGAAGAIGGVVEFIDDFLNNILPKNNEKLDDISAGLSAIQNTIKEKFAELEAEQRAAHILGRLSDLDPPIARAQGVYDILGTTVQAQPPVSEEFRLGQIGLCLDAVNELGGPAADNKWTTVFQDEIYYGQDFHDMWAGVVAPAADANGLVFSNRYILPFFMMTLNIFMAVAAALEPDYQMKFRDPLRRYTARLQKVHDTSKEGIVTMRRPTRSEILDLGLFPVGEPAPPLRVEQLYGGHWDSD